MNHVYRNVWNEITRTYVAAAETVKGRGKKSRSSKAARAAQAVDAGAGATARPGAPCPAPARRSRLALLALEQRMVFDGALVVTDLALPSADDLVASTATADRQAATSTDGQDRPSLQPVAPDAIAPAGDTRREIVFVDGAVPQLQALLAELGTGREVVVIDAARDGVAQMAQALATRSGLDAIHILSHGAAGELQLGSTRVDAQSLQSLGAALQAVGSSLSETGDLLLYGCDVAQGQGGELLVQELARLTGADVAASIDTTGARGDWALEQAQGPIEASTLSADAWRGDLNGAQPQVQALAAAYNEASPAAVFKVSHLSLGSNYVLKTQDITTSQIGGKSIRFSTDNGASWKTYNGPFAAPASGEVLVSVALQPERDGSGDSGERFELLVAETTAPAVTGWGFTDPAGKYIATVEPAGAFETGLDPATVEVFTFNSLPVGTKASSSSPIVWPGVGKFTGGEIAGQGGGYDPIMKWGGAPDAKGGSNYIAKDPLTLELDKPADYLGVFWTAGGPGDVLELYSGEELVATFTTDELEANPADLAEHRGESATWLAINKAVDQDSTGSRYTNELFLFLNVTMTPGVTFDKAVFTGSIEADNYTVRFADPNAVPPPPLEYTRGEAVIKDDGTGVVLKVDESGNPVIAGGKPVFDTAAVKDADGTAVTEPPAGCYLPVTINVLANDFHDNGAINPGSLDLNPGATSRQTTANATWQGQVVGTFAISPDDDGTVVFTPNETFRGKTDALTYSVADYAGVTRSSTLTIGGEATTVANTVSDVNSLELFVDDNSSSRTITTTGTGATDLNATQSQTLTFSLEGDNPYDDFGTTTYDYLALLNQSKLGTEPLTAADLGATSKPLKVTASLSGLQYGTQAMSLSNSQTDLSWNTFQDYDLTSALTVEGWGVHGDYNTGFYFLMKPDFLVGKPYLDDDGKPMPHRMGQVTITFNGAVTNPLMHLYDFGGFHNNTSQAYSPHLKLVAWTTEDGSRPTFDVVSEASGAGGLLVDNAQSTITRSKLSSGFGTGTVRLEGNGITSLTFEVSEWVVNYNTPTTDGTIRSTNDQGWDGWNMSFSVFPRPPEANPDAAVATKLCGVDDVVVNEGSPYAVFKVLGYEGRTVKLDLASGTGTLGVDTGSTLEYWDGNAWQLYTPGSYISVPGDGDATPFEGSHVLVRVAIINDAPREVSEQLTLKATYGSGTEFTGTLTILDDGEGTIFATSPSNPGVDAQGNPILDTTTPEDNDAGDPVPPPLAVNSLTVNETSPYAVFTVTGEAGRELKLALASGTAGVGLDTGTKLQYWDGSAWKDYDPTKPVTMPEVPTAGASCAPPGQSDSFYRSRAIVSTFHGALYRAEDGNYFAVGEFADPLGVQKDTFTRPKLLTPENGYNYTGTLIDVAAGSGNAGSSQYALLTTDGLWIWGYEGNIVHGDLTTSGAFQKVALPQGLNPTDVKFMSATEGGLALVTHGGEVWINRASYRSGEMLRGNGENTSSPTKDFTQVKLDASTVLTGITDLELNPDGGFAFNRAAGKFYTWGFEAYLGNGSAPSNQAYAKEMTGPLTADGSPVSVEQIQTTGSYYGGNGDRPSYFVLGSDGRVYALGENAAGQLGQGDLTEKRSWVVVKDTTGTAELTQVSFISAQNNSVRNQSVSAVLKDGTLLSWGDNDGGSYMLGLYDFVQDRAVDTASLPTAPLWETVDGAGNTTLIPQPYPVFAVENGGHFTVAVPVGAPPGFIAGVGHNVGGVFGDGTTKSRSAYQINGFIGEGGGGLGAGCEPGEPTVAGRLLVRVAIVNDPHPDNAETFTLTATYVATQDKPADTATGTGTILDDGTGTVFGSGLDDPSTPAVENPSGVNPDTGLPVLNNTVARNDDRPITVTGTTVNETSPYVIWQVQGAQGQSMQLALADGTAQVGPDTGTALEYFNGSNWVAYTPGSFVVIPTLTETGEPGVLMVRTTPVVDALYETSETVLLQATASGGGTATGESVILDGVNGAVYDADVRPVLVLGETVQESAGWLGFDVVGTPGELVTLALQSGTGTLGTDTGTALQYSLDGTTWQNYSAGQKVALPADGELQVRVAVTEDTTRESSETVILVATPVDGVAATGTGTILDNDNPALAPVINDLTVNEASPYAVFTVEGLAGAGVTLTLANGSTSPATGSATPTATDGTTDYGTALEVFNGSAWVPYDANTVIAANGKLLVRVAIANDEPLEVAERFTLTVAYTGAGGGTANASATGTATITDDGTGTVFFTGTDNDPATEGLQPNLGVDALGNPQIDFLAVLNNDAPKGGDCIPEGQTETFYRGRFIVSSFHSAFYRAKDGGYFVAGENMGADGVSEVTVPTLLTPGNGYGYTGTLIDIAAVSTSAQHALVTTEGLWVWGTENELIHQDLTSSPAFQKITLPAELNPAQVKFISASGESGMALVMKDGTVWTNIGTFGSASLRGDGSTTINSEFRKVLTAPGTPLTGITDLEFNNKGVFAYSKSTNTFYTWGPQVYLGNGSGTSSLSFATAMTGPALPAGVTVEQVQVTDSGAVTYYVLGSDGRIYVMGANHSGQAGRDNTTEQRSWTTVFNENKSGPLENVVFISGQNATKGMASVSAIQEDGRLLSWGKNDEGMIGTDGSVTTLPEAPNWLDANGNPVQQQPAPVLAVENGGHFTGVIAVGRIGEIATVGHNPGGAFGDGTTDDKTRYQLLPFIGQGGGGLANACEEKAELPLGVNSITVNEASPYAVFTVQGRDGETVSLSLTDVTATGSASTTPRLDGTQDYGTRIEYWDGAHWTVYDPTATVQPQLSSSGKLLVRVAISNDRPADNGETFTLTASYPVPQDAPAGTQPESATGTATITDDGTGTVFASGLDDPATSGTVENPTGVDPATGLPLESRTAVKNDDRPLAVTGTTVNEASPYVVWTVDGAQGQMVQLALQTGTATVGTDTGTQLQYFNGTAWVNYTAGSLVPVPTVTAAGEPGVLMVRTTPVVDAPFEMSETVLLQATNSSGMSAVGVSTILDDGTGALISADVTPVVVTGQTVTEPAGSGDATVQLGFAVSGKPGETVTLALQSGTGTVDADTAPNSLQVLIGTTWTPYTTGMQVTLPADGQLQVRVAVPGDDTRETSETITLVATPGSGIPASGEGTILDNEPLGSAPAINNIEVNEASPYAVFTVEGLAGAGVTLTLADGTTMPATGGSTTTSTDGTTDYVSGLEVFDGTAWVAYDPAATVVGDDGRLLVRVAIVNDTPYEVAEQFTLTVAYTGTGGGTPNASATGTATILDDGTGTVFLTGTDADPNTAGVQPALGVDGHGNLQLDALTPRNDDRTLAVNNLRVNEGSPYAVFTVTANEGEPLLLSLASGTATVGTDTGAALEVLVGGQWVPYQTGMAITVPSDTDGHAGEAVSLLVRVAVKQDAPLETAAGVGEQFTLTATYATGSKTATGTCEILDNGTGELYGAANTSGTADPLPTSTTTNPDTSLPTALDNDVPLTITGQTVNEASPYLVFTVSGQEGQPMTLSLQSGSGTVGVDTGTALEVFNGTAWVPYTPGQVVELPSDGDGTANEAAQMLVRVSVVNDAPFEGAETLTLVATEPDGAVAKGVGTVVDDGTGVMNAKDDSTTTGVDESAPTAGNPLASAPVLDTTTAKNDDRGANPAVSDVTVNEGSPYAVFTVSGVAGAGVTLNLADGTASVGVDTGSTLQVFNTSTNQWVPYSASTVIGSNGSLLVRVAVAQDSPFEVSETFSLVATYNNAGVTAGVTVGGSGAGTGTILDDGTGSIFLAGNTTGSPSTTGLPTLDDDRAVSVTGGTVHEADGYLTFTVNAYEGQKLTLALDSTGTGAGHAELGTDAAAALEYWNGSAWTAYTAESTITVPSNGDTADGEPVPLLVRVAVNADSTVEQAETLKLTATTASGRSASDEGTILDGGVDLKDDDRPLTVTGSTVNEASPYLVFTVGGVEGQLVQLNLADGTASVGNDTGTQLQYFDGQAWVNYTPGSYVAIPTDGDTVAGEPGQLLVRVAVTQDNLAEVSESVTLVATNTGGRPASDLGHIKDDGTGVVFLADNESNEPSEPADTGYPAALDNDRPLSVNSVRVNEASPYAVFTVTGKPGDTLNLALADGTAVGAASPTGTDGTQDFGTGLQVFVNGAWVPYTPGVTLPAGGDLLVRVAIVNDAPFEGEQTFTLTASYTGGNTPAATGTGIIVDDGTGVVYATSASVNGVDPATGLPLTDVLAPRNDDRAAAPAVNSVTVNEGSPYLVFTVDALPGSKLALEPASGTAVLGIDTATQWQVLVNGTWTNYTPGAEATADAHGQLLVRVALVQDAPLEVAEKLTLKATYSSSSSNITLGVTVGASATGTATIVDDGTGDVFGAANKDGEPDAPGENGVPTTFVKDDDRPLEVTGTTVNEGSPYVIWTVEGAQGQPVALALQSGTGSVGADTGTQLEVFNGIDWVAYTPGSFVPVPMVTAAGEPGVLMVRTTLVQDVPYEMSETVLLRASNTSGGSTTGASTILDDGKGALLGADVTPVVVTGQTVTEPLAAGDAPVQLGFTVTGEPGETVTLALQSGTGTVGTDTAGAVQVLIGSTWTPYTGQSIEIPAGGQLQVRVAVPGDVAHEPSETITLVATPSSGIAASGEGTILDNEPAGSAPVVNSIEVNEASPYAVFTVEGVAGAGVTLTLGNDTNPASRDAGLGIDTVQPTTGSPLEVFNGSAWVAYNASTTVIAPSGKLLVRVALVNDAPYEGSEVFDLTVAYNGNGVGGVTSGASATGTATILDDGTGAVFLAGLDANPATPGVQPNLGVDAFGNPQVDDYASKNDDRTLTVNNLLVNEGSPYAVFTVTAHEGERLLLDLSSGTATIGTDTGSALEVFDGTAWVPYVSGDPVTVPADGDATPGEAVPLLVRVAIRQDAPLETTPAGGETFTLSAVYADGSRPAVTGTAQILDNGRGTVFATGLDDPATSDVTERPLGVDPDTGLPQQSADAPKDNDQPLSVTGQTVQESAGRLLFTVSGSEGQALTLALASGTGSVGQDTGGTLEVYLDGEWVPYVPGSQVIMPSDEDAVLNGPATLQVRVSVTDDSRFEGDETVTLTATAANGTQAEGTGTIVDNDPAGANPAVSSVTVNERSPYAVFSVEGLPGAGVTLELGSGTATVGVDTGSTLEVFNGTVWVPYSAESTKVPASGELLVRVGVRQDAPFERSESFNLTATYNDTGITAGVNVGASATGTGTIVDDGTGGVFLSTRNSTTPNQPGDYGYPSALDDDRRVVVEGDTVYESDGHLRFTVSGTEGQAMTLALASGTATLGADTGTQLQYFDGSAWVNYNPGAVFRMPDNANGVAGESVSVQFRVAVAEDAETEPNETLTLTATTLQGQVSAGEGVILDGNSPVPVLDDDRPVYVDDVTVNEGSPFAVFSVTGPTGQFVRLALGATSTGADATLGTDTGALQVWDGDSWENYTAGDYVQIPEGAAGLLVRVAVTADTVADNGETFTLRASTQSGRSDTGLGTIKDDGTGVIFATGFDDPTEPGVQNPSGIGPDGLPITVPRGDTPVADPAQVVLADDDRSVTIDDVTVNEGSPYAVFTVGAHQGQYVRLDLGTTGTGDGHATLGQDTGALQYWDGAVWTDYTPGTLVKVPGADPAATTQMLVRVKVAADGVGDNGETFTLTVANTGAGSDVGLGTIKDDGTGTIFATGFDDPAQPGVQNPVGINPDGTPATVPTAATPAADPAQVVLADDDRPVTVDDVRVNEGSPFAVFTVGGVEGQYVKLDLGSTTSGTDATLGTDTGTKLEYWSGNAWTPYTPGTFVQIPGDGDGSSGEPANLLVRVAIRPDTLDDGGETFTLKATNTGGTGDTGLGTIVDDGTGTIFAVGLDDPSTPADESNADGVTPATAMTPAVPATLSPATTPVVDPAKTLMADDDRPLTVDDVTVNEGSPFAVFTVGGKEGQYVKLDLAAQTATAGTDYVNALEVWNGSAWTAYTPGTFVQIPGDGDGTSSEPANLLVRVAIKPDALSDNGEIFTLKATNTGGKSDTGLGTIVDDGTGAVFSVGVDDPSTPADESAGPGVVAPTAHSPATPAIFSPAATPVADPVSQVIADDDRPVTVNDITVNEGSPFAVFTVGGREGQYVKLELGSTGSKPGDAALGTDTGTALEVWNGSAWTAYTPGTFVQIPGDGDGTSAEPANLLVRVAITPDAPLEGAETFTLTATNTGGTSDTGLGTIVDDGTGTVFATGLDDPSTAADESKAPGVLGPTALTPAIPATLSPAATPVADPASQTIADDDRPLTVNDVTVNEGSPFIVFKVGGAQGQYVGLSLGSDTADVGTDTGTQLQFWNGTAWTDYTPGSLVRLPGQGADGQPAVMLVRVAVTPDFDYEVSQQFLLQARNAGGSTVTGIGTIVDEGNGDVFLEDNATGVPNRPGDPGYPMLLDDDRPRPEAPKLAPPPPPADPILQPALQLMRVTTADTHVQSSVASTRQADPQQVADIGARVGLSGEFRLGYADSVDSRFARITDPNVYVGPAVFDVADARRNAAIPSVLLQTGLLMEGQPLDRGGALGGLLSQGEAAPGNGDAAQPAQAELQPAPDALQQALDAEQAAEALAEQAAAAQRADEEARAEEQAQWLRIARLFEPVAFAPEQAATPRLGEASTPPYQGWRFGDQVKRAATLRLGATGTAPAPSASGS